MCLFCLCSSRLVEVASTSDEQSEFCHGQGEQGAEGSVGPLGLDLQNSTGKTQRNHKAIQHNNEDSKDKLSVVVFSLGIFLLCRKKGSFTCPIIHQLIKQHINQNVMTVTFVGSSANRF